MQSLKTLQLLQGRIKKTQSLLNESKSVLDIFPEAAQVRHAKLNPAQPTSKFPVIFHAGLGHHFEELAGRTKSNETLGNGATLPAESIILSGYL